MNEKGPKYAKLLELIGDVCRFSLLIYVVLHVVTWSWSWEGDLLFGYGWGKYQDRVTGRCLWANIGQYIGFVMTVQSCTDAIAWGDFLVRVKIG